MKRYFWDGSEYKESIDGNVVFYEDVEKLIIRLTQGAAWNNPSLKPINGKDCIVMLITGERHPAIMTDNGWVKAVGYLYDFNKHDIIKWRYDETI